MSDTAETLLRKVERLTRYSPKPFPRKRGGAYMVDGLNGGFINREEVLALLRAETRKQPND